MKKPVEIAVVLLAGAIGGEIGVMQAWSHDYVYPVTVATLFTLLIIPLVKGATAGGFGVYLLTSTDTAQIARTLFFALACGIAFPAVLSNANHLADSASGDVAGNVIDDNSKAIDSATAGQGGSVEEVQKASLRILDAEAHAPAEDRQVAQQALDKAVDKLAADTNGGNEQARVALKEIVQRADSSNLRLKIDRSFLEPQPVGRVRPLVRRPQVVQPAEGQPSP